MMLFENMPKAQVQPDIISDNAAISSCEKAGEWQEALVLLEGMSEKQTKPNVISCSHH